MNFYDYLAYGSLIIAIGVNSLMVYLQKKHGIYNRFGNQALNVHSVIISLVWGFFIVTEFLLVHSNYRLDHNYPILGIGIMTVALTIFTLAVRQIGFNALANGNYFGYPIKKLGGIYKIIPEPIYVSYVAWFIGLGFVTELKSFFIIAVVTFIGLIGLEAAVERV